MSEVPDATKLAVERTRLAHERTLMAWVRTSTSLISFGFTIYKFFQYLREHDHPVQSLIGPREFALVMIGIGVAALVVATIQHELSMHYLRKQYGVLVPRSLASFLAVLICLFGVVLFIAALFRQ